MSKITNDFLSYLCFVGKWFPSFQYCHTFTAYDFAMSIYGFFHYACWDVSTSRNKIVATENRALPGDQAPNASHCARHTPYRRRHHTKPPTIPTFLPPSHWPSCQHEANTNSTPPPPSPSKNAGRITITSSPRERERGGRIRISLSGYWPSPLSREGCCIE
jgi:hypothetical protein